MGDWQERLSEAMEARGITGAELARRAGFTSQYINSMRNKDRGARLPLDTARRLGHALGVSVEWLTSGTGPRERLSDVYPIYAPPGSRPDGSGDWAPESTMVERYPSRAEAIALLSTAAPPEVLAALRTVVPSDPEVDPGRDFWIDYAKDLVRELRRIRADPDFASTQAPISTVMPISRERPPPTVRKKSK